MKPKPLKIRSVTIGGGKPAFILGPCVIESEKFVWRMARKIAAICKAESVPFIFKASYDKANRTSISSFRGPGLDEGLRVLADVRSRTGLPVSTDIHEPAQAAIAARAVDEHHHALGIFEARGSVATLDVTADLVDHLIGSVAEIEARYACVHSILL